VAKDESPRYLQCVACLVMVEMVYIVFLGAVMTLCMWDVVGWCFSSCDIYSCLMVCCMLTIVSCTM
jgi:hypothetical protein